MNAIERQTDTMVEIYHTCTAAHAALCLDAGYDPLLHTRPRQRVTRAVLAAYGYIVDPQEARRREKARAGVQPEIIAEYECDHGHRWTSTAAQRAAQPEGHYDRCPVCGEYWV